MVDIYCHDCGGFICDPRHTEYRLPPGVAELAVPRSSLCSCTPAVIYGPPPGYLSSPGMPRPEHRST
jgi:hypothetical protein